ncbi:ABC transporter permease [Streptomyces avicenniae]|uniref:ABC transporter permease n=1 Tax=Streptomyces avicenniae TaxID=500153 RepID=UPI000AD03F20|nr:ABC transporter permease [Streptomyces avicenniae]
MPASPHPTLSRRALIAVVVGLPVFVAFALWAFAWPAARTAPNDLPVGVAGPPAATSQVADALRATDGAFDVHVYPDEDAARDAVQDRDVYGAFVLSGDPAGGTEVLTATAGGPVVAQLLTQAAQEQAPPGTEVTVTDVVPAPEGDPRGSAFTASVLPLALAGIAGGALVTLGRLRGARALVALAGSAVLLGGVGAVLAHSWLGVLEGPWFTVAGVLALTVAAGGATVAGIAALVGKAGIGLGALVVMLLGNPWSGAGAAPEMLPDPAATLGQFLPTGAGATLLRSVAFFDGGGAAAPVAVLAVWTALGVGAILLGARRQARSDLAKKTLSGVPR